MIDSVIFWLAHNAAVENGNEIFAIRDPDARRGDPCAWIAYAVVTDHRGAMPLVARRSRREALAAGKAWQERKKNPIRCCGQEISPIYEARCLRCGADYR